MPKISSIVSANLRYQKVFPDKELVAYTRSAAPTTIRCPIHGEVPSGTLDSLLRTKHGCPECNKLTRSEYLMGNPANAKVVRVFDSLSGKTLEFVSASAAARGLETNLGNIRSRLSGRVSVDNLIQDRYKVLLDSTDYVTQTPQKVLPEGFKLVEGFENYALNRLGQVYNVKYGRLLTPSFSNSANAVIISLYSNGEAVSISLAKLMLQTFRTDEPLPKRITYKDGDRRNCSLDNLA